jgi:two-component system, NarL family, invasion response regulator UvrY
VKVIQVFIADDHEIVRNGIRNLIAGRTDMVVCGEADSGDAVIEAADHQTWDVLILDVNMPGCNGFEVIKHLKTHKNCPRIVVFSMYKEDNFAVALIRAGARGFINKKRSPQELIDAVLKVSNGEYYITDAINDYLLENQISLQNEPHESLSAREYEIFLFLLEGKSSVEIAKLLGLSANTIHTFVSRIKVKLGVNSIVDIVKYGQRNQLSE